MKKYKQLSEGERHIITAMRRAGYGIVAIANELRRHRTTIWRELKRNRSPDKGYRAQSAGEMARGRRRRSRRKSQFSVPMRDQVMKLLDRDWSPEQISGHLRRTEAFNVSHETIYRWVWDDMAQGGYLWKHLRCSCKKRRKRYGRYDSRGRLAGKRMIQERPDVVEQRMRIGDWEIDTVHGSGKASIVTLLERLSGFVLIAPISRVTKEETTNQTIRLLQKHRSRLQTITADNGCEFHDYPRIEEATGAKFYFATPHHAWERGSNENVNGLIRQYLPKGYNMANLTQSDCNDIGHKLNSRPRKRLDYRTPYEVYYGTN